MTDAEFEDRLARLVVEIVRKDRVMAADGALYRLTSRLRHHVGRGTPLDKPASQYLEDLVVGLWTQKQEVLGLMMGCLNTPPAQPAAPSRDMFDSTLLIFEAKAERPEKYRDIHGPDDEGVTA